MPDLVNRRALGSLRRVQDLYEHRLFYDPG